MAITLRGSATGLTGGTNTTLAFTLPTGHTANDLLVALIGTKPYSLTVSSGTLTTDGWTQRSQGANGTTANGLDAGSVFASLWTKVHDGSESNPTGTLSGTPSPRMSGMIAFQSTLTGSGWSLASTNGSDATETGTTLDVTGAADPGFSAGDEVLVLVVHNTDAITHTSPSLTITGCTVANLTQQLGTTTTNAGNDGGMFCYTADITAGTSSAAPRFQATTPTGDSDAQVIFLRIREPQNRTGTVVGDATAPSGAVVGTKAQSQNVAGSVTGVAPATTGAVIGSSQRKGTVTGDATVSGTVTAGERHTGTVTGDASASGTVIGTSGHAGMVTGEASATGTITGTTGRAGTVTGEATVFGVIIAGEHHDGFVTGEVSVSGDVFGTPDQPVPPDPAPTPSPVVGGRGFYRPLYQPVATPVEHRVGRVGGDVAAATGHAYGRRGLNGAMHGAITAQCVVRGAKGAQSDYIRHRVQHRSELRGVGITTISTRELRLIKEQRDLAEALLLEELRHG